MWHWSSAVDPPTYPPMPTWMNIRYWLHDSDEEDERQLWIEAYVCALRPMDASAMGHGGRDQSTQWVPVWGTSATLTMSELCAANDLNNMVPSPFSELELAKPLSPKILKGIPGGAESETNSSAMDSRDEWDKTEGVGVFSHCSTPTTKIGPTWAEVHTAAQKEVMVRNRASTWEEIVGAQLPGDSEDWDGEDSQFAVEPHFEEAIIEEDEDEEQVVIESVTEELEEPIMGEQLTHERGEVTIGTISQEDVPTHVGEVEL